MAKLNVSKEDKEYNDLMALIEHIISNLTGGYGSVNKDTDIQGLMDSITNYRDKYIEENIGEIHRKEEINISNRIAKSIQQKIIKKFQKGCMGKTEIPRGCG